MSEPVFVEQRPNQGTEHRMESGATIGREGCDISLGDPDVSRRHAAIRLEGDAVTIEDLGSTNGTFVNGERIGAPRQLRDGDEVQIGVTVLRLRAPSGVTRLAQAQPQVTRMSQATTGRPAGHAEPPTAERAAPAAGLAATAAGPVAPAEPPPAEPPGAAPPAGAPPTPTAEPATTPPAGAPGSAGRRGDVPAPDFQPSAIRRVVPPPDTPAPFGPAGQQRRRGSAATRLGATVFSAVVVASTAAAVILYYITEPFK
jgi:pSer/pThr/pTyr-binding forkhead associated (FHA) protein